MYFKMKLPMMSERDCIMINEKTYEEDGSIIMIQSTQDDHPDYPLKQGTIRMKSYKGIKMW